jgi:hypothetical protein
MPDQQVCSLYIDENPKLVTCGAKTTFYSAVVASPATVRLASSCGLEIPYNARLRVSAGLHADIQTLAALRELGMPLNGTVVEAVAQSGRLSVLQHLITEQQSRRPLDISYYAARSGNISMLNWLRAEGCEFNHRTCAGAAQGRQLAALQHLRSEGANWDADEIGCEAAMGGSIEVVEWLRQEQGIEFNSTSIMWAADGGQIAMCQHLRSIGCEWTESACAQAVTSCHFDMLRWLRENGCPWSVYEVSMEAASVSNIEVLDYIVEQGEVLDAELLTDLLAYAGSRDQLEAAQWLRQRGAEWPVVLRDTTSTQGDGEQWSDDMIAWARAEGCDAPLEYATTTDDDDSDDDTSDHSDSESRDEA